jgi:hypothetical protein
MESHAPPAALSPAGRAGRTDRRPSVQEIGLVSHDGVPIRPETEATEGPFAPGGAANSSRISWGVPAASASSWACALWPAVMNSQAASLGQAADGDEPVVA